MTVVHLVADDLTGALDSAAQFTGRIGPFPVLLRPDLAAPPGSHGIDLACRDGTEAAAVGRTVATARQLADADVAFKKIDSLLRGHWAAELAAIVQLGLFRRIVLAPAFPKQGRMTRDGRQHARDAEGRWWVLDRDPVRALAQNGVAAGLGFDAAGQRGTAVVICDAMTDDDLYDVVRTARSCDGATLYCGTAGLAAALSDAPPPQVGPPPGPHLMIVGSNHSVSLGQTAALAARHPDWRVTFDGDGAAAAARIDRVLAASGRCVAVADLPLGLAPAAAATAIATWLRRLMPRLSRPSVLTVVGGETFAAVCAALGVERLVIEGEWHPGVPASRMAGGRWSGTPCFSKSGAFGGPDALIDLLDAGPAAPDPAERIDGCSRR